MCLLLIAYDIHPAYRLVLAANRDEYYDRPTRPLSFWEDAPDILAGRDLKCQGTWLALTRTGRWGAITNFREQAMRDKDAPSRGHLVSNFNTGKMSPKKYLEHVKTIGKAYNGFNLLVGDRSGICYYSNRGNSIQEITSGIYGISNHLLDTPWPKVEKGKADLETLLANQSDIHPEDIFRLLGDRSNPSDKRLPDTGVGLSWERILSPLFITSDIYGTRSSAVILEERSGRVSFSERTYMPGASGPDGHETREYHFTTLML
ncbi:MAG: NRDE family protein [Deltaproteobacteria bacterium]|nr:NRDE family protein [Deltaproteobacteria bacterium]